MVEGGLARFEAARDLMRSRGPDGAGVWDGEHVVLGHRRLSVVDVSSAASQPMVSVDGRYAIVYNGELYNDADLRRELGGDIADFRTGSDTETVLRVLMRWGAEGLDRLRGMYALAFVDQRAGTVLLARDPLGIKPLYWAQVGSEIVFASQLSVLLRHPGLPAKPDPVVVSAYLTTIRTSVGERTLFQGVRVLRPGAWLEIGCSGEELRFSRGSRPNSSPEPDSHASEEVHVERVRRVIEDSVRRHLRSDVPVCCLLSGGLDSSIIATVARRELGRLHTFCSGEPAGDDFAAARLVAAQIGAEHIEAPVTREWFSQRWREMVDELGGPLSTPNEVAINLVAQTLRDAGMVVALSGEGADELFAGYEGPMAQAAAYEAAGRNMHPGEFQLLSNAWIAPALKPSVLSEWALRASEGDETLIAAYRDEFDGLATGASSPLQAHLRFHRRINLAGLLQRLDTATMLESIEGRTPFADRVVMDAAEALPMPLKFRAAHGSTPVGTKIALRRAFADVLPDPIVQRPKASFPLPFQSWLLDSVTVLNDSAFAREWFTPAARAMVQIDPARAWGLAWPMLNIAMWGRRWWG